MKSSKSILESTVEKVLLLSALISVISVIFITVFIFQEGLPLFTKVNPLTFLFTSTWEPTADIPQYGILAFIMGSIWVTVGALLLSVPVGLAVGIFMAEMAKGKFADILRSVVQLLAGIPSVIYGLFGYIAISPVIRIIFKSPTGLGVLTASIVLAIMTLPTIINITEVSLRAVPQELKEGSLALGATHWMTIYRVMVPSARSGILAGIVLGMGRAVGETMAVLMVAGNAVTMPKGPLSLTRTLTMNIATDMKYAADDHAVSLFTTGIVLLVFILGIKALVQYLMKKAVKEEV
ncbi:phosphate ABC transporter permease subunit PstC [Oceanispirochaeta sp.]|uniref:phosphate ABC transporter permease subunit PstC n=1 Tax=Oceanispirochaeta sp. TaxID=2035350 RepID=UPI00261321FB|nr:phosphate ABC transporter permease subunit PstC [Oceanispirochaeta sp.]MDA3959141.1 phosphate ABC transporter permease subunit PstC [Oceanispirochaeta sp.]